MAQCLIRLCYVCITFTTFLSQVTQVPAFTRRYDITQSWWQGSQGQSGGATTQGPPKASPTFVRLHGGYRHNEGFVQLYLYGKWTDICWTNSQTVSDVACRSLGFPTGNTTYFSKYSSTPKPSIFTSCAWDGIQDMRYCDVTGLSHTYTCLHYHAWVQCEDYVRLVNGPDMYSGRVEVYYNGTWGTVCDDHFDRDDALVICKMLNLTDSYSDVAAYGSAHFGSGSGHIIVDDLQCNGRESDISLCYSRPWLQHNCGHGEDAGVVCGGTGDLTTQSWVTSTQGVSVRLVNGFDPDSGRVEIYHNGAWHTVCDRYFGHAEAKVICRQLGQYNGDRYGEVFSNSRFGRGNGRSLNYMRCNGYENDISACSFNGWQTGSCSHYDDVGIHCSGYYAELTTEAYPETTQSYVKSTFVRFDGRSGRNEGWVQVFSNGRWIYVCQDGFDQREAEVTCRSLGFPTGNTSYQMRYDSTDLGTDIQCAGGEQDMRDCTPFNTHYCNTHMWVECENNIRLVGAPDIYSGRVEVYYNGAWGTICDDQFDRDDAYVICRMLNISYSDSEVTAFQSAHYGSGRGKIIVDDLECDGNETDIADCYSRQWLSHDCSHTEDASVSCKGYGGRWGTTKSSVSMRLVNGFDSDSGRVEIYHNGAWYTVCDRHFGYTEANVLCRQQGSYSGERHGAVYPNIHFGRGYGRSIDRIQCHGNENDISACDFHGWRTGSCSHDHDVGIHCNGLYVEHTTDSYQLTTQPYGVPVRLVNGTNNHRSGLVELYHNGVWRTVCGDHFSYNEVRVICKQLGKYYGDSYGRYYADQRFGSDYSMTPWGGMQCSGHENDISGCFFHGWTVGGCSYHYEVGIDCGAYRVESTTRMPYYTTVTHARIVESLLPYHTTHSAHHVTSKMPYYTTVTNSGMSVRLVNGSDSDSGRVEIYHNGAWHTVCNLYFGPAEATVICRQLGHYNGERYVGAFSNGRFGRGNGRSLNFMRCNGYENDISACSFNGWQTGVCSHNQDVGIHCNGLYSRFTTKTSPTTTRLKVPSVSRTVIVSCDENGWQIDLDMNRLRQLHPSAIASDIYLGENSCTGIESFGILKFRQGLQQCLTNEIIRNDVLVYSNELIYAQHDRSHPFIIKSFNWTVPVECDVERNATSHGHLHHIEHSVTAEPPVVGHSKYSVNMTFYQDPNFVYQIQGNPLQVMVGSKVYVKVFTQTSDWNVKMRVHTCYTKPSASAPAHLKYYIIKNGCEVDSNTHIILQYAHETRFVFQDFEYTTNHEGIYLNCDANFCDPNDYSNTCSQTCHTVVRRSIKAESP